ncbi:hypothetical protein RvY_11021 [Ramazzottius varieornatus]|uniref:Uncharacterized protein n=1 Tax=Ramazzottius varieornatus TaxID=947166 RepID=A0A1D1VER3_RAMVA|nr:hypothetical protein RvY_11021 [Ramazzottius varieornatus]
MRETENGAADFLGYYRRDGWNAVIHWLISGWLINRMFLPKSLQSLCGSGRYQIFRGKSPHRATNVSLAKFGFHSFPRPKKGVAVRRLLPAGFLYENVFGCLWTTDVGFHERSNRLLPSQRLVRLGKGYRRKAEELTPGLFVVLLITVSKQFQKGSRSRCSSAFGDPANRCRGLESSE